MATATSIKTDGLDGLRADLKNLRKAWDDAEADRAWFEQHYPGHVQAQALYAKRLSQLNDEILAIEQRLSEAGAVVART